MKWEVFGDDFLDAGPGAWVVRLATPWGQRVSDLQEKSESLHPGLIRHWR
jgi:hypothetical protein